MPAEYMQEERRGSACNGHQTKGSKAT